MTGPWESADLVQSKTGNFKARVMENYEAPWHEHPASDEVFIVLSGNLEIDLGAETHTLFPGQIFLVPSGTRHRSRAKGRVELLIYDAIQKEES
jgi:mannose-6-phosphate isomerase-like protein (cupin superfamily)